MHEQILFSEAMLRLSTHAFPNLSNISGSVEAVAPGGSEELELPTWLHNRLTHCSCGDARRSRRFTVPGAIAASCRLLKLPLSLPWAPSAVRAASPLAVL